MNDLVATGHLNWKKDAERAQKGANWRERAQKRDAVRRECAQKWLKSHRSPSKEVVQVLLLDTLSAGT